MIGIKTFRKIALSFPGTAEQAHFDRAAFKVIDKRIFATLHEKSLTANLKFSEIDQSAFCIVGKGTVYPVPNKFGKQGWTTFELNKISEDLLLDALSTAYKSVFSLDTKRK